MASEVVHMKAAVTTLALLALATVAATAAAQPQPALLFVMSGQSNAGQQAAPGQVASADAAPVGGAFYYAPQHTKTQTLGPMQPYRGAFGPELSFARAIRAACPGRTVIVAKRYLGGTSIIAWEPTAPNAQWKRDMAAVGHATKPPQFDPLAQTVAQAVARYGGPVEYAGVLWLQVERDSRYTYGAVRYEGNLRRLVTAWRNEWHAPALPVVAMDSHTQLDGGGATVHEAIVDVAATVPGVGWVETRDLSTKADNIHFDSAGVVTFGERLAAEWLRLSGGCG